MRSLILKEETCTTPYVLFEIDKDKERLTEPADLGDETSWKQYLDAEESLPIPSIDDDILQKWDQDTKTRVPFMVYQIHHFSETYETYKDSMYHYRMYASRGKLRLGDIVMRHIDSTVTIARHNKVTPDVLYEKFQRTLSPNSEPDKNEPDHDSDSSVYTDYTDSEAGSDAGSDGAESEADSEEAKSEGAYS